ncbi:hypothetical protein [Mycobacterium sp. ACS4331]|uniref:hypothetical protein n=1 Tax=Mycobacterium sp. ACS4331 TaxID=1834121 RepID=UPI0007FFBDF5|nr:hypothetical protein [Mycobacterium sp. ACS4331]OBF27856.1 hypothetical protein A5727_01865 [Mycobacterium sp. ACS4331]
MGALLEGPATLSMLLRALHAERQSVLRQQDVLRAWLDGHDPNKSLRISLRANGFGLLLNEFDAAHRN